MIISKSRGKSIALNIITANNLKRFEKLRSPKTKKTKVDIQDKYLNLKSKRKKSVQVDKVNMLTTKEKNNCARRQ